MLVPLDSISYAPVIDPRKPLEHTKNDLNTPVELAQSKAQQKPTTLTKAIFNLTKSAIGLGALFLPGNMKRMGLIGGCLMILLGALTCSASLHFLARASSASRVGDYFKLGELVSGKQHARMVAVALVIFQLGGLIAYAAFAGQYMGSALVTFFPGLLGEWVVDYKLLSPFLAVVLVLPLSCLKEMRTIANAAIAGMACVLYIFLLTCVDYFVAAAKGTASQNLTMFRFKSDFLNAFSSIVFAFVNHFTLVTLVPDMHKPTPSRRSLLISISSFIVTAVYVGMGVFGYLHFGNAVTPDILSAPVRPSLAYGIGSLAMSLVLIVSYPLQCDPTRTACDQLLPVRINATFRHVFWTGLIVLGPCTVAVTLRAYVMPILEVFSSFCGSLLVFILPPYYFIRLVDSKKISRVELAIVYFNMAFGAVVLVGGTIGAVIDMIKQFQSLQ